MNIKFYYEIVNSLSHRFTFVQKNEEKKIKKYWFLGLLDSGIVS